jgi:hypothetical protein
MMMIFIGLLMFILGVYLYFRIIRRDKVRLHKFNYLDKFRRNMLIYFLIVGGIIVVIRELIIWLTS